MVPVQSAVSTDTIALARTMRATALRMVHRARASHIGSCLSAADLLAVELGHRSDTGQPVLRLSFLSLTEQVPGGRVCEAPVQPARYA